MLSSHASCFANDLTVKVAEAQDKVYWSLLKINILFYNSNSCLIALLELLGEYCDLQFDEQGFIVYSVHCGSIMFNNIMFKSMPA